MRAVAERAAAPAAPAHRRPSARLDWIAVTALVVAYGVLQAVYLKPPFLSDQLHYLVDAALLPTTTWPEHQTLRIGLVIPVRAALGVFGYSEAAYYAVPFLSGAGLVTATYWLGRLMASRLTGVAAAVLVVFNPYVLIDSSDLLPDVPAAALFTGACVLLLQAGLRQARAPLSPAALRMLLALAGLGVGWSYLTREFLVFWFPVVPLLLAAYRIPLRLWGWVAGPAAAMFGVELAWGAAFHGDPLARITAALNQPESPFWRQDELPDLIASGEVPDTPIDLLLAVPRELLTSQAGPVFLLLAALVLVAPVVLRDRRITVLAGWALGPFVLLSLVVLATWALDARILRPEKLRYWLPLWPPLVVGGFLALQELARRVAGPAAVRTAGAVMVTTVVVTAGITAVELRRSDVFIRTGADYLLEVREWLATDGQECDVLWTDDDHWRATTRVLPLYTKTFWGQPLWEGEIRALNRGLAFLPREDVTGGALVRNRISLTRRALEEATVPDYLRNPPDDWPELLPSADERFRIFGVGDAGCR